MKKNVAIIIQKLTGGGAEKTAANLSINLSKDYNVYLYVFNTDNITYSYQGTLRTIDNKTHKSFIGKFLNIFKRIKKIKKLKKNDKIDVAISLLTNANYVNVKSKGREKTIVSVRINIDKISRNFLFKTSLKKADAIVSLSKSVERQINDLIHMPYKTVTIYNSIAPLNGDIKKTEDNNYIATAGRLTYQKGHWHLIRAFQEVVKEYPTMKLLIAGAGELDMHLKELITKLNLEKNVIMCGYVDKPKELIYNAKLFVFPSLFEGLGNAIVEALQLGKCVISTDCEYGPKELLSIQQDFDVKDNFRICDYGVLIPKFDMGEDFYGPLSNEEKVLAKAIIYMLKNDEERNKLESKALLRSNDFNEMIITDQWKEIIEK